MTEAVATMPEYEKVMVAAFDNEPGSVGLIFDAEGKPFAAWAFTSGWSESVAYGPDGELTITQAGISTTELGQRYDWIDEDETNPLGFVYSKSSGYHEWADGTEQFFEITADNLVDLTEDESGNRVDGQALARTVLDAGPGRFFAVVDEHRMVSLITRSQDGSWRGDSCGPDVNYLGPFPSTEPILSEIINDGEYDTPFCEDSLPERLSSAAEVRVSGTLPFNN